MERGDDCKEVESRMKCKWHKEVMRDADKYGDDPNAVDFLESEYVEIFNGMMSQYYPYPY